MGDKSSDSIVCNKSLEDLILSMEDVYAHIKDVVTGGYISSNKKNLEGHGLSKLEEIIGKTVHDLDGYASPCWGNNFAQEITDLDLCVIQNNKKAQIQDKILIARRGFVCIHDITKIPITDKHNKVVAILTHAYDKTGEINLISLFGLYKNAYTKNNAASEYFCRYLQIDGFFSELPSCAELMFLLYTSCSSSRDDVAKKMSRSIKTIETHVTHINNKLKCGDFSKVVNKIRSFSG